MNFWWEGRAVHTLVSCDYILHTSTHLDLSNSSTNVRTRSVSDMSEPSCTNVAYSSIVSEPIIAVVRYQLYSACAFLQESNVGMTRIFFQHFHARIYTGEVVDCNSEHCKTSNRHIHKTGRCDCPEVCTSPGCLYVR